jgi:hypothetical protein
MQLSFADESSENSYSHSILHSTSLGSVGQNVHPSQSPDVVVPKIPKLAQAQFRI